MDLMEAMIAIWGITNISIYIDEKHMYNRKLNIIQSTHR